MKTFLHLLRRELADRRYFFAGALAIGFMPYVVALVAVSTVEDLTDIRTGIALVILAGYLFGVPLVLGARWLVAEFASGRRAFELARPISAWALCASKLAAIATMILGGALVASVPTAMAAFGPGLSLFDNFLLNSPLLPPFLFFLLVSLSVVDIGVVFVLAQISSFLFVARTRQALADFGTLLLFIALLAYAYQRCDHFGALAIASSWLDRLGLALVVLGVYCAWRSFRAGSLFERAHRRHSVAMNLGLLACGAISALAAAWVVRPDAEKLLLYTRAVPNADGSRWLVAGLQDPRGFEPVFAVDPDRRQATYLAPRPHFNGYPWPSADGRRIGFLADRGRSLQLYELQSGAVQPILVGPLGDPQVRVVGVDDRLELMVALDPSGDLRSYSLSPGRDLARVNVPDVRGSIVSIFHREGSLFNLLVQRENDEHDLLMSSCKATHFVFDAQSGAVRRGNAWSYRPVCKVDSQAEPAWWRQALPLLESGIDFSRLAPHYSLASLSGNRGVMPATVDQRHPYEPIRESKRNWVIFDKENDRLGSFEAHPDFLPVGEIRPGLLLVGRLPEEVFVSEHHRRRIGEWQTLVVDVPSGRILRVLEGFAPVKHPEGGKKVWLVDRMHAPHDLESAEAEPRPILPWLPVLASQPWALRLDGG